MSPLIGVDEQYGSECSLLGLKLKQTLGQLEKIYRRVYIVGRWTGLVFLKSQRSAHLRHDNKIRSCDLLNQAQKLPISAGSERANLNVHQI